MRIIVSPVGSAGDVHPFIGLSLALKRRGHDISFVTNRYFREMVIRAGLEYVELGTEEDFLRLAGHPDLWHPVKAFPYVCRHGISPFLREHYQIFADRFEQGRTLMLSSCLGFGARFAQEKLGIPLVTVHLQPAVLWSEYDSPALPNMLSGPGVPSWLKRSQFWLGETFIIDRAVREVTRGFRRELGLPPVRGTTRWWNSPLLVLCLFPTWYARPQPDWPPNVALTQFPLWDESDLAPLPTEVERFLEQGDAPIVFTPGSAMLHGREFFQTAVEACQRLRRRGLLLSRFVKQIPPNLPDDVRHFEYVPFSQVLPRAAAVVHHGGIGTTAQGLAAGIPQLVMPMAHDQPDNAARLKRFGVGDWLKPRWFGARAVAQRLAGLLDSEKVRRSCAGTAARFVGVDGLEAACEAIEQAASRCR